MANYKAMICYRGQQSEDSFNGAKIVNDAIIGEGGFLKREEVLFEEEEKRHLSYTKVITETIPQLDYFIIVLGVDFFSDMINRTKEELSRNDTNNIAYKEIYKALDSNRKIISIKIGGFNWNNVDILKLNELFAPDNAVEEKEKRRFEFKIATLINTNNIDISNEKAVHDIREELKKTITERTILEDISKDSEREIVKKLANQLDDFYRTLMGLHRQLDPENNRPEDYEYYLLKKTTNPDLYYIPQRYINGIKFPRSYKQPHVKGFNKIKDDCILPDCNYYYWPIELLNSQNQECDKTINICALCFAVLLIYNWKNTDRGLYNTYMKYYNFLDQVDIQENNKIIDPVIDGAVNLLITLRDGYDFSWMSKWAFTEPAGIGTVNQTTLSLSTLLTVGFLSSTDNRGLNELKNRYYFIMESKNWLVNKATKNNGDYYWVEGDDDVKDNGNLSVLLTVFGLETYIKIAENLQKLLEIELIKNDNEFCAELKKEYKNIINEIIQILNTLNRNNNDDVKYLLKKIKVFMLFDEKCKIFTESEFFDNQDKEKLKKQQDWAKKYIKVKIPLLLNDGLGKNFGIYDKYYKARFDGFSYNGLVSDKGEKDKYYNCIELIYGEVLLKGVDYLQTDGYPDEAYKRVLQILNRYNQNDLMPQQNNCSLPLAVETDGFELKAPIFVLYYYRILVQKFLSYYYKKNIKKEDKSNEQCTDCGSERGLSA